MNPELLRQIANEIQADNDNRDNFQRQVMEYIASMERRLTTLEGDQTPVPIPDSNVFAPDFEQIDVSMDQEAVFIQSDNPFTQIGFDAAKATNITGSHMGRLYTTRRPDGNWLAVESEVYDAENSRQTDIWLHKEGWINGRYPADFQMEFDIISEMDPNRDKFCYPNWEVSYPASTDTYPFLVLFCSNNYGWSNDPALDRPTVPGSHNIYLRVEAPGIYWEKNAHDTPNKIMQNVPIPIPGGVRTRVRIRIDMSCTRSEGGIVEAWIQPERHPEFKVMEYIHGQDVMGYPFRWDLERPGEGVPRARIPTTINAPGRYLLKNIIFGSGS